jgi:tellurite resistance protein
MSKGSSSPGLLDEIIRKLQHAGSATAGGSLLSMAGAQYSHHSDEELTQPTGFDPQAAALFEAIIESAYLVATADGHFDDREREAFEHVVLSACAGSVQKAQLGSLLSDLQEICDEDGADKRVQMLGRAITRPEQAHEVLRIAALIAQISEGVSPVERGVLDKLAREFKLEAASVDLAIDAASSALSG